jgi:hypothetical protein
MIELGLCTVGNEFHIEQNNAETLLFYRVYLKMLKWQLKK